MINALLSQVAQRQIPRPTSLAVVRAPCTHLESPLLHPQGPVHSSEHAIWPQRGSGDGAPVGIPVGTLVVGIGAGAPVAHVVAPTQTPAPQVTGHLPATNVASVSALNPNGASASLKVSATPETSCSAMQMEERSPQVRPLIFARELAMALMPTVSSQPVHSGSEMVGARVGPFVGHAPSVSSLSVVLPPLMQASSLLLHPHAPWHCAPQRTSRQAASGVVPAGVGAVFARVHMGVARKKRRAAAACIPAGVR